MPFFTGQQLLIASRNRNKIKEISTILEPLKLELSSGFDLEILTPDETGKTFLENALIKAQAYCQAANMPAMADDSGLSIEALNGFPGVDTAPFAEQNGGHHAAAAILQQKLQGKTTKAFFTSCVVLMLPDGRFEYVEKQSHGHLVFPPRGNIGWGFDIIFVPDGYDHTYAEMSEQQKMQIDHRGRVVQELMAKCFTMPHAQSLQS